MARIVTGVEINRQGIQAVEIAVFLKKQVQLLRYIEEPIEGDVLSPDGLSLFFAEHGLSKEEVVAAVPGDLLITREISVPFRERSKIEKILPYEMEPLVPFPIDELDLGYRILRQEQGRSELLVYALPKSILDQRTQLFEAAQVPLRMISVSSLSAANTLLHTGVIPQEGEGLHLHVTSDFSILSLYRQGKLSHFTRIQWSNQHYFDKIQEVTGLERPILAERLAVATHEEAAEIKEPLSEVASALSGQIQRSLQPLLLTPPGRLPNELYVTGAAPGLHLLTPLLAARLSKQVEIANPLPHFEHSLKPGLACHGIHAPLGMALMQGGRDAIACTYRKKKTSFVARVLESKRELRYALFIGVFLLLGLLADFTVGIQAKEHQYSRVEAEMRRVFDETFPGVKIERNILEQYKLLVAQLKKQNEIFENVFGEKPSPLEILLEITTRIPAEIQLIINNFSLDDRSVRFVGWTESFNSVNRIEQELRKSDLLATVKVSNAKVGKKPDQVNFQMTITFDD